MFTPFFKWWWAVSSGALSLVGFLVLKNFTIELTSVRILIVIFSSSAILFLLLTIIYKSWELFNYKNFDLTILHFQKNKEHGGKFDFIIESNQDIEVGTLLTIRWNLEDSESIIGILEVISRNSNGNLVAKDYYIKPVHLRKLNDITFNISALMATTIIPTNILKDLKEKNDYDQST